MPRKRDVVYSPEIIIALAGSVGVNFDRVIDDLENELNEIKYQVNVIKLADIIGGYLRNQKYIPAKNINIKYKRLKDKMAKCSKLRHACDKAVMGLLSIAEISSLRQKHNSRNHRHAYIIKSLKRPEEVKLLKQVYGENFILLSIYSPENIMIKYLAEEMKSDNLKFCNGRVNNKLVPDTETSKATKLIQKDEAETSENIKNYGQDLRNTFPLGSYFIRIDVTETELKKEVNKFIRTIFGDPFITPTKEELNMFMAKGISLRSSDLSRQVGAVICNDEGEVLSCGCNEVPRFGGGYYWIDDKKDFRDFQMNIDSNYSYKCEITEQIINNAASEIESILNKKIKHHNKDKSIKPGHINAKDIKKIRIKLEKTKIKSFDLLEFGRAVHAEEAAICEAAKKGISLRSCTLYCTTFPCHLCIKHVIAVGIKKIVYIDPFPKSKAEDLFGEAIDINPDHECIGKIDIQPFIGASPEVFLQKFSFNSSDRERKNKYTKCAITWNLDKNQNPRNTLHRSYLSYCNKEIIYLYYLYGLLKNIKPKPKLKKIINEYENSLKFSFDMHGKNIKGWWNMEIDHEYKM